MRFVTAMTLGLTLSTPAWAGWKQLGEPWTDPTTRDSQLITLRIATTPIIQSMFMGTSMAYPEKFVVKSLTITSTAYQWENDATCTLVDPKFHTTVTFQGTGVYEGETEEGGFWGIYDARTSPCEYSSPMKTAARPSFKFYQKPPRQP
jgi:hypothetical protein